MSDVKCALHGQCLKGITYFYKGTLPPLIVLDGVATRVYTKTSPLDDNGYYAQYSVGKD